MKDSKSLLLLVVSVLLILVSCALLWTWGFNFGNFAKDKQTASTVFVVKDSTTATNATRDSLKKIYEATISNISKFDSTLSNADSLKDSLDLRLSDFYKLRNEIAVILKNPVKKEDLDLAKQKISELQKKNTQLRTMAEDVETENKKLLAALQQLTENSKENTQAVKPVSFDVKQPATYTNTAPANIPSPATFPVSSFATTDMRLTALMMDADKEQETNQALQADKFLGSFSVKNNLAQFNSTEIVVVILQPDNKVMQVSAWETGRFETREGMKVYSCKVKFEYTKGENKRLSFSMNADKFQKGTYVMQLYYNGSLIGKTTRTLI